MDKHILILWYSLSGSNVTHRSIYFTFHQNGVGVAVPMVCLQLKAINSYRECSRQHHN